MIREVAVTALDGLVGFRQPIESGYNVLDSDNLASSSGLMFEDATGIIKVKNIIDSYEYDTLTSDQINDVLDNIRYSAARDVLNIIFNDNSVNLESNTLFPYEEDFLNTYDLTDDFYYIEFVMSPNRRVAISLDNIYLSFNESATFNVYLYHSKSLLPIQTKQITTVANESTKLSLGWIIDSTGTYRIGYKKADVGTAKPFQRDFELADIQTCSKYAQIYPYSANFLANGRIDVNNDNSLTDGYGINLEYSSFMDWTYEITKNKDRFSRAIQLQMAITVADRIITSSRSNITNRLNNDAMQRLAYVVGNEANGTGLKGQFRLEVEAIKRFFFPKQRIKTSTLQ